MAKPTTIAEYIAQQPEPLREIADKLRQLIDGLFSDGSSALFQGHPVWGRGEKPGRDPICYLKAYPKYVTFGFWHGQEIADSSGRLEPGSRAMASVKLRGLDDIDTALFTAWLTQASDI
ncbi:DUF1801 domain-containing protein [Catelliglobosispora koreensis]|uniref:DUF1801 domain-containing protein n=1 Tax=Catelliglobosispora koreensis TaxID=129052 RepID=UPI000366F1B7|nr:DUF1801 domain-containing protein [Catelliglobosispora koreensis]